MENFIFCAVAEAYFGLSQIFEIVFPAKIVERL